MHHLKFLLVLLFISFHCLGQNLIKDFDASFGGTGSEYNVGFIRCSQGGYAMLAASSSDSSFSKSQNNRDSTGLSLDYWLVRFDNQGNKLWDRTYGGDGADVPSAICELPNGDFILAGTSSSGVGYEKTEVSRGGNDFWILRVDVSGNIIWDKTIGGSANDYCKSVTINSYGQIFCGGYTLSSVSGDKTSLSIGTQVAFDYWLVALNQNGQILFDRTLGSTQNDNCNTIVASNNGGALLLGYSDSPAGFNKSQGSRGLNDFWVIAVDSIGRKIWDKTLGGAAEDYGYCALKTADAIYLGGDSYSLPGFDKTALNKGVDDMWLVKLSLSGNIIWDRSFGSFNSDEMNAISGNSDGSILLSGESYSAAGFDKSESNLGVEQLWMIQIDTAGTKIMDKTFFTLGHDEEGMAIESAPGNYLGCISSIAGVGGYKSMVNDGFNDVWVCALKPAVGLDVNHKSNFKIYPNPISWGQLHVICENSENTIGFYDMKGVLLKEEKTLLNGDNVFDVSDFTDGLYLLKVQSFSDVIIQRMVICKP